MEANAAAGAASLQNLIHRRQNNGWRFKDLKLGFPTVGMRDDCSTFIHIGNIHVVHSAILGSETRQAQDCGRAARDRYAVAMPFVSIGPISGGLHTKARTSTSHHTHVLGFLHNRHGDYHRQRSRFREHSTNNITHEYIVCSRVQHRHRPQLEFPTVGARDICPIVPPLIGKWTRSCHLHAKARRTTGPHHRAGCGLCGDLHRQVYLHLRKSARNPPEGRCHNHQINSRITGTHRIKREGFHLRTCGASHKLRRAARSLDPLIT